MELRINFSEELESEMLEKISYIKNEFDELFGYKMDYTPNDKQLALDILEYFSKTLNTTMCIDFLADTLTYLERSYNGLFN